MFFSFTITAITRVPGSKIIKLSGGKLGDITFPHHTHQKTLEDCNLCHKLFPMVKKSINKLKAKGDLKKKFIMNTCQKCHSKTRMKNQKSGPMNCSGCHKR